MVTYEWRRGDLANGGSVGLDLVALESIKVVLAANTLVGRAALAQEGVDGGKLGLNILSLNILVEDNDVAVGDDILGGGVADLQMWLVSNWRTGDEWQEGGREGDETLGELHDVLWKSSDVVKKMEWG